MTRLTDVAPLLRRLLLGVCERDLDRVVNNEVHEFVESLPLISTALANIMPTVSSPSVFPQCASLGSRKAILIWSLATAEA